MKEEVIIPNPENLEKLKQDFKSDGKNNCHVLIDFDKTLTKYTVKGEKATKL